MNNSIDFTVIIPTYNRAHTLKRAIDSVLNQTYKNFELIVVNDGSTDSTEDVLISYGDQIKILCTENRGVSAARNYAVSKAQGSWLAFLDSDDEWLENKLEKQNKFIMNNPNIPIVHGEEIWIRKGRRVNPKFKHKKHGGFIFQKCLPLCLISPSAVCIEKNVFLEHEGFDEEYVVCEDYDLWLKLTSLYEVGFIEDSIIKKYGGHDDQLSAKYKAMDYWRLKSMLRILKIRNLNKEDTQACLNEIKTKSSILLLGYEKHGHLDKVIEVKELLRELENDHLSSRFK